ncbi:lytic transglycosylase domain-containing protein, partial [Nonomuraea sp. NPDC049784]
MSGLPSFRAVMLMVIAVLAVTAAAGGIVVIMGDDLVKTAQEPVRGQASPRQQQPPPRLDQLVPTAQPVKEFGKGGPGVTVTPPRVLAIAAGT